MDGVDVSVCIASFRRPAGLARLLASLGRAKLPEGVRVEAIVVDNDADAPALLELPAIAGMELRALGEMRRNIAHARNTAVAAARGEWVAFVDDDEEVDERWLAAYWERAQAGEVDGWFGPVLPRLEREGPRWLSEDFYTRPRPADGAAVDHRDARTGNAFVRRTWLGDDPFDPEFGRSGGEDSELFRRLGRDGARFAWCDAAVVHEWVPPERRRFGWLLRRAFRGGCVHVAIERKHGGDAARGLRVARVLAAGAFWLASAAFHWPLGPADAAPRLLRAAVQAGQLWALLGGRYEEYRRP